MGRTLYIDTVDTVDTANWDGGTKTSLSSSSGHRMTHFHLNQRTAKSPSSAERCDVSRLGWAGPGSNILSKHEQHKLLCKHWPASVHYTTPGRFLNSFPAPLHKDACCCTIPDRSAARVEDIVPLTELIISQTQFISFGQSFLGYTFIVLLQI